MKEKFDRETRIKLFFQTIRNFIGTFTKEAFIGIPAEKLEQAWDEFYKELHRLRDKYPMTEFITKTAKEDKL